ncbi:MAG: hypothetical protein WDW38_008578 [Sanguina aurantia]
MRDVCVHAAKGKGSPGGKKGSPKTSLLSGLLKKKAIAEAEPEEDSLGDDRARPEQYKNLEVLLLLFTVCQSYWKATGKRLMEDVEMETLATDIFKAPFALLVHDKFQEGVTDPKFTYGNKAALSLWDANWDQLVGMESRKSAPDEVATQADRNKLLEQAATKGVIMNYGGARVSVTGKKFKIRNVTLFNVVDAAGVLQGQAAVFNEYETEDGTVMVIQGELAPRRLVELPPTEEEIAAAQQLATDAEELVRELKDTRGLVNTDPEVQAAVGQMKARREDVAALKRKLEVLLAASQAAFDDEE